MKKHQGNAMAIAAIFMLFSMTTLSLLFNQSSAHKNIARHAVVRSVDTYSLLAFADLSVDALLYDFTQSSATAPFLLVGTGIGLDSYDTALSILQETLFDENNQYVVTEAENLIIYNDGQLELQDELLHFISGFALDITLLSDLEVDGGHESNELHYETGDTAILKDIRIQVSLSKGMVQVTQEYLISGLLATYQHNGGQIHVTLSSNLVSKELISQKLTA